MVGFNVEGVSAEELKRGYVAGDTNDNPPKKTKSFIAQVCVSLNQP